MVEGTVCCFTLEGRELVEAIARSAYAAEAARMVRGGWESGSWERVQQGLDRARELGVRLQYAAVMRCKDGPTNRLTVALRWLLRALGRV